jgi:hypothetical protein
MLARKMKPTKISTTEPTASTLAPMKEADEDGFFRTAASIAGRCSNPHCLGEGFSASERLARTPELSGSDQGKHDKERTRSRQQKE